MAKILIIDDDVTITQLLTMILKLEGHDPVSLNDSTRAMEALPGLHPDLITLDLMMPGMTGFELCELLHRKSSFSQIPVLIISARDDPESRERAFQAGASDYLTKPFDVNSLMDKVNKLTIAKSITEKLMPISSIFSKAFLVPESSIDENGHVNNVAYVQWMQDIAVEHYASIGGVRIQGPDATWVVREHRVEYLLPAFAGEELLIKTWVENLRRVRSLRKYEFVRKSDGKVVVRGESDWVFVNVKTGMPSAIPEGVTRVLTNGQKFE